MAIPAEYNNIPVEVGEQGDPAPWGPEYTQLLTTIMQGSLVQNGDNFSLSTVDGDFGALFGIVSIYAKSRSVNIASAGFVRMAVADTIAWRNNLNDGNLLLAVNGSNFLTFNGQKLLTQATPGDYVASITGTANQIIASAATGAVTLSLPQNIATTSTPTFASETLTATSNQLVLGTTRTVTVTAPTPASASRTVTLPDLSGDYDVVGTTGAQTVSGAKTFNSETVLLKEAGGSDVVTVAVAALGAGRTYTVPDAGGAADFVMNAGAQTIAGVKTFSSSPLVPDATTATQAAAFGQIKTFQTVQTTSSTNTATTSSTFAAATNMTVAITPTSNTHRVKITVQTVISSTNSSLTNCAITIKRGSTELSGVSAGFALLATATGTVPAHISFIDSPATTSSTTYQVFVRSADNTTTVSVGNAAVLSVMIAEEIV